jgi:putative methylase
MKKRELEIILESLEGFQSPKITLEQYITPPKLAAFILNQAQVFNDLHEVVDLGCGTGILAIGASILGAYSIGFDVDIEALKVAVKNAVQMEAEADFVASRVEDVRLRRSVTTIMNPPFGIQKRHADRPFLEKAFEISDVIYTIHSAGSERFVRELALARGFRVTHLWKFEIPLKKTYSFHEKAFKYIPVEVFRIQRE